jgi:LacI family transcriptional regulator
MSSRFSKPLLTETFNSKSSGITLHDVAERAGVSKSTVSRALNNASEINEATRQKVLKTCKQMGYMPNRSARALRTGSKSRIAVIVEDVQSPWYGEILAGIHKTAAQQGFDTLLLMNKPLCPQGNVHPMVHGSNFDGAIYVACTYVREIQLPIKDWDLPCVCAYSICTSPRIPSVIPDDYQGGHSATSSLIHRGHRNIAVIMGPASWIPCQERVAGYQDAMRETGYSLAVFSDWTFNDGYREAKRLLDSHPEITAFFAGDDHIAAGIIYAVRDIGKRVPDDIAVVGFGNMELATHVRPAIASIRMPLQEIGATAANILLSTSESHNRGGTKAPNLAHTTSPEFAATKRKPFLQRIECELIERESLG